MDKQQIYEQFALGLQRTVYGRELVYLDNAATSMRPRCVTDKLLEMSTEHNANVHRAVHKLSNEASQEYENAREAVRAFIGAPDIKNVIFTSGTTASINLVANTYGRQYIKEGDEIIIAESEHHSDIVPWQMLCSRNGASIKVLPVDDSGHLQIEKLPQLICPGKTKLICVAQVSNVLGLVNPIKEIIVEAHKQGIPVLVDGAQGIVHCKIDVSELGCDFYTFSGHKVYAATGTGVLYMAELWTEKLEPWMGGGEMIHSVSWSGTTYETAPLKFEAGTPNINAVPTFIPALKLAAEMNAEPWDREITAYLLEELPKIAGLRLFGQPETPEEKTPIFSICIEGAHHEDLALILDKMGVAVRSGHMCADPLMDRFGVNGMLRASFAPYNTLEQAKYFIQCLKKAVSMLV